MVMRTVTNNRILSVSFVAQRTIQIHPTAVFFYYYYYCASVALTHSRVHTRSWRWVEQIGKRKCVFDYSIPLLFRAAVGLVIKRHTRISFIDFSFRDTLASLAFSFRKKKNPFYSSTLIRYAQPNRCRRRKIAITRLSKYLKKKKRNKQSKIAECIPPYSVRSDACNWFEAFAGDTILYIHSARGAILMEVGGVCAHGTCKR